MIYYFSGNGNTRYLAMQLGDYLNDHVQTVVDVEFPDDIRGITELGIVCPVYSWGVPVIILDFISSLPEKMCEYIRQNNIPVWFACTCGDETGDAPEIVERALSARKLRLAGSWSLIMPNTYVLLPGFDVDSPEVERKKIEEAPARIKDIANAIKKGQWTTDIVRGSIPHLKSKLVYPLFKKWGIFPKKWRYTAECVQCGRCAGACPVGNIKIVTGFPKWGKDCTSCLACYHICPTHAVAYGNITEGKGQYKTPAMLRVNPIIETENK